MPQTSSGMTKSAIGVQNVQAEMKRLKVRLCDIRKECLRSSGRGGQNVNKTSTKIRLTHLPTGIVVTNQDERSQRLNFLAALVELTKRIDERARLEQAQLQLQRDRELRASLRLPPWARQRNVEEKIRELREKK